VRELIETGIRPSGICLGPQDHGAGRRGKTFKMKFGHHGANHPVKDLTNDDKYSVSASPARTNGG
jgi:carbamoyl-phosphate synthase small subunit